VTTTGLLGTLTSAVIISIHHATNRPCFLGNGGLVTQEVTPTLESIAPSLFSPTTRSRLRRASHLAVPLLSPPPVPVLRLDYLTWMKNLPLRISTTGIKLRGHSFPWLPTVMWIYNVYSLSARWCLSLPSVLHVLLWILFSICICVNDINHIHPYYILHSEKPLVHAWDCMWEIYFVLLWYLNSCP